MPKIKYKCGACRFEFAREDTKNVEKCPYCGRSETIVQMKGDFVSKVLDEVSSMKDRD